MPSRLGNPCWFGFHASESRTFPASSSYAWGVATRPSQGFGSRQPVPLGDPKSGCPQNPVDYRLIRGADSAQPASQFQERAAGGGMNACRVLCATPSVCPTLTAGRSLRRNPKRYCLTSHQPVARLFDFALSPKPTDSKPQVGVPVMYRVLLIAVTVAFSASVQANSQQGSVYGRSAKVAIAGVTLVESSSRSMPHDESVGRFDS